MYNSSTVRGSSGRRARPYACIRPIKGGGDSSSIWVKDFDENHYAASTYIRVLCGRIMVDRNDCANPSLPSEMKGRKKFNLRTVRLLKPKLSKKRKVNL